jgi:hypothetical protein
MRIGKLMVIAALVAMPTSVALGQQAYVYPMQGQTPAQQDQDQGECHGWAVQQSGYNPYQGSTAQPTGGVVRGAAGGAAIGAVAGAIAGDAGEGAAAGAAAGALFGGLRQHRQRREQAYQSAQLQDAYTRAFAACMEARGYSVK